MNIALTTTAFLCGLWWLFQTKRNSTNPAIRFRRVAYRVSGRTIKLALKSTPHFHKPEVRNRMFVLLYSRGGVRSSFRGYARRN